MQGRMFYVKDILKMAIPIIYGNIGFIMIGVGDVIVAGRHSTDTLAAISIATAITHCIMIFGIGILCTISPILSNYRGENKKIEEYFYPSLIFTFLLSCFICAVMLGCIPIIDKIGFAQNLTPMVKDYFFITAFATFGGYLHCMSKEYLQSFEIVVFPNILTVFCIFLNVLLNVIFAFGYGVIPEMGVKGLAIASLMTRYFMGLVLLVYCYKKLNIQKLKHKENLIKYYKDLLRIGMPSSLATVIEFAGFNIVAVVMGRISGLYAAAHNLICTLTSVAFMIPLAISNALGVKVGFSNGATYFKSLKNYAFTGLIMSAGVMGISAIILGLFPELFVKIFTNDSALINVCIPIVYILCTFQIFDGLQVTLAGIFKGLKNTKIVMLSNIVSYWFIAFPLGCLLGLHFKLNLFGFWLSIALSSIILVIILYSVMIKKFKQMSEQPIS